jgi:hypothetical protein
MQLLGVCLNWDLVGRGGGGSVPFFDLWKCARSDLYFSAMYLTSAPYGLTYRNAPEVIL